MNKFFITVFVLTLGYNVYTLGGTFGSDVTIGFEKDVKPIFQSYCIRCHSGSLSYETSVKMKDKIYNKLVRFRQMPPKYVGNRPTEAEIAIVKEWIETGTKK